MNLADPGSNINRDGTVKENGEGTLTKCKCGIEFFLSFENGFICDSCKKKNKIKITDELVENVFRKHDKK